MLRSAPLYSELCCFGLVLTLPGLTPPDLWLSGQIPSSPDGFTGLRGEQKQWTLWMDHYSEKHGL